jgi:hypothetical protein
LEKGQKVAPRQGGQDLFLSTMSQPPTYSPKLADGSERYTFKAYDFEYNNKNPIAIIENKVNRNTDDYIVSPQIWLDINLAKGLSWYTKGAMDLNFTKWDDFRPQIPLYNFRTNEFMTYLDVGGEGLQVESNQNVYYNLYSYINYDHIFKNSHNVKIQIGYNIENNVYEYLRGYRKNILKMI